MGIFKAIPKDAIPAEPVAISHEEADRKNDWLPFYSVVGSLAGGGILIGTGTLNIHSEWYDLMSGAIFFGCDGVVIRKSLIALFRGAGLEAARRNLKNVSPVDISIAHFVAPFAMMIANYPYLAHHNLMAIASIPIYALSRAFAISGETSKLNDYSNNKILSFMGNNATWGTFIPSSISRGLMLWPALSAHHWIWSGVTVLWGIADSFLAANANNTPRSGIRPEAVFKTSPREPTVQ